MHGNIRQMEDTLYLDMHVSLKTIEQSSDEIYMYIYAHIFQLTLYKTQRNVL